MIFKIGQIFETEIVKFQIVNIIPVTKCFSKIEVNLYGGGIFSDIDIESSELETAVSNGKATLLSDE